MTEKKIKPKKPTRKSALKVILGTKSRMTQILDEDGRVHGVTAINATPSTIVALKTKEKDGYDGILLGFGERKEKNLSKPVKGQMAGLGFFKTLREFRGNFEGKNKGDKIDLGAFGEGEKITITSLSKGKGFQGVVKRHGFKGGPRSHGQKHSEREPGSIGGGGRDGGRVAKGMRMAGRDGNNRITIKNLKIIKLDSVNNVLYVRGAVPGAIGGVVEIRG